MAEGSQKGSRSVIITTYEGGATLQYFDRQAPGGSDFVCVFSEDGRPLMWFEPEVALRLPTAVVQGRIQAIVHMDAERGGNN